jgi:C4-dicarboxylate-specific signal transduction histidine kinase
MINAPLFDWVIENLLKNALDAMEGHGSYQYYRLKMRLHRLSLM